MDSQAERYFCLRFDVDTPQCLHRGSLPLLELAKAENTSFTFFINPGRAISRWELVENVLQSALVQRTKERTDPHRLPTTAKLSLSEILYVVAFNPCLLPGYGRVLRSLADSGHELGLHGGRNHSTWQNHAHQWDLERTTHEVAEGLRRMVANLRDPVSIFASPGWNTPPGLEQILAKQGFDVLADSHGHPGLPERYPDDCLIDAPTWLAGEPGGIGYIEWHRAQGHSDQHIVDEVTGYLETTEPLVCLYDHPFFAGRYATDLLRRLLRTAKDTRRQIKPLGTAARALVPEAE